MGRLGCSEAQLSISAHLGSSEFFSGGQCDVGHERALVTGRRLGHLTCPRAPASEEWCGPMCQ
jgi:hypothetical protein